ncbi:X-element\ORF2 [Symbiodinium sp. CCMP2592]|nr:X-element\ORF2 [Symbiodinium sp. CCMP2592]
MAVSSFDGTDQGFELIVNPHARAVIITLTGLIFYDTDPFHDRDELLREAYEAVGDIGPLRLQRVWPHMPGLPPLQFAQAEQSALQVTYVVDARAVGGEISLVYLGPRTPVADVLMQLPTFRQAGPTGPEILRGLHEGQLRLLHQEVVISPTTSLDSDPPVCLTLVPHRRPHTMGQARARTETSTQPTADATLSHPGGNTAASAPQANPSAAGWISLGLLRQGWLRNVLLAGYFATLASAGRAVSEPTDLTGTARTMPLPRFQPDLVYHDASMHLRLQQGFVTGLEGDFLPIVSGYGTLHHDLEVNVCLWAPDHFEEFRVPGSMSRHRLRETLTEKARSWGRGQVVPAATSPHALAVHFVAVTTESGYRTTLFASDTSCICIDVPREAPQDFLLRQCEAKLRSDCVRFLPMATPLRHGDVIRVELDKEFGRADASRFLLYSELARPSRWLDVLPYRQIAVLTVHRGVQILHDTVTGRSPHSAVQAWLRERNHAPRQAVEVLELSNLVGFPCFQTIVAGATNAVLWLHDHFGNPNTGLALAAVGSFSVAVDVLEACARTSTSARAVCSLVSTADLRTVQTVHGLCAQGTGTKTLFVRMAFDLQALPGDSISVHRQRATVLRTRPPTGLAGSGRNPSSRQGAATTRAASPVRSPSPRVAVPVCHPSHLQDADGDLRVIRCETADVTCVVRCGPHMQIWALKIEGRWNGACTPQVSWDAVVSLGGLTPWDAADLVVTTEDQWWRYPQDLSTATGRCLTLHQTCESGREVLGQGAAPSAHQAASVVSVALWALGKAPLKWLSLGWILGVIARPAQQASPTSEESSNPNATDSEPSLPFSTVAVEDQRDECWNPPLTPALEASAMAAMFPLDPQHIYPWLCSLGATSHDLRLWTAMRGPALVRWTDTASEFDQALRFGGFCPEEHDLFVAADTDPHTLELVAVPRGQGSWWIVRDLLSRELLRPVIWFPCAGHRLAVTTNSAGEVNALAHHSRLARCTIPPQGARATVVNPVDGFTAALGQGGLILALGSAWRTVPLMSTISLVCLLLAGLPGVSGAQVASTGIRPGRQLSLVAMWLLDVEVWTGHSMQQAVQIPQVRVYTAIRIWIVDHPSPIQLSGPPWPTEEEIHGIVQLGGFGVERGTLIPIRGAADPAIYDAAYVPLHFGHSGIAACLVQLDGRAAVFAFDAQHFDWAAFGRWVADVFRDATPSQSFGFSLGNCGYSYGQAVQIRNGDLVVLHCPRHRHTAYLAPPDPWALESPPPLPARMLQTGPTREAPINAYLVPQGAEGVGTGGHRRWALSLAVGPSSLQPALPAGPASSTACGVPAAAVICSRNSCPSLQACPSLITQRHAAIQTEPGTATLDDVWWAIQDMQCQLAALAAQAHVPAAEGLPSAEVPLLQGRGREVDTTPTFRGTENSGSLRPALLVPGICLFAGVALQKHSAARTWVMPLAFLLPIWGAPTLAGDRSRSRSPVPAGRHMPFLHSGGQGPCGSTGQHRHAHTLGHFPGRPLAVSVAEDSRARTSAPISEEQPLNFLRVADAPSIQHVQSVYLQAEASAGMGVRLGASLTRVPLCLHDPFQRRGCAPLWLPGGSPGQAALANDFLQDHALLRGWPALVPVRPQPDCGALHMIPRAVDPLRANVILRGDDERLWAVSLPSHLTGDDVQHLTLEGSRISLRTPQEEGSTAATTAMTLRDGDCVRFAYAGPPRPEPVPNGSYTSRSTGWRPLFWLTLLSPGLGRMRWVLLCWLCTGACAMFEPRSTGPVFVPFPDYVRQGLHTNLVRVGRFPWRTHFDEANLLMLVEGRQCQVACLSPFWGAGKAVSVDAEASCTHSFSRADKDRILWADGYAPVWPAPVAVELTVVPTPPDPTTVCIVARVWHATVALLTPRVVTVEWLLRTLRHVFGRHALALALPPQIRRQATAGTSYLQLRSGDYILAIPEMATGPGTTATDDESFLRHAVPWSLPFRILAPVRIRLWRPGDKLPQQVSVEAGSTWDPDLLTFSSFLLSHLAGSWVPVPWVNDEVPNLVCASAHQDTAIVLHESEGGCSCVCLDNPCTEESLATALSAAPSTLRIVGGVLRANRPFTLRDGDIVLSASHTPRTSEENIVDAHPVSSTSGVSHSQALSRAFLVAILSALSDNPLIRLGSLLSILSTSQAMDTVADNTCSQPASSSRDRSRSPVSEQLRDLPVHEAGRVHAIPLIAQLAGPSPDSCPIQVWCPFAGVTAAVSVRIEAFWQQIEAIALQHSPTGTQGVAVCNPPLSRGSLQLVVRGPAEYATVIVDGLGTTFAVLLPTVITLDALKTAMTVRVGVPVRIDVPLPCLILGAIDSNLYLRNGDRLSIALASAHPLRQLAAWPWFRDWQEAGQEAVWHNTFLVVHSGTVVLWAPDTPATAVAIPGGSHWDPRGMTIRSPGGRALNGRWVPMPVRPSRKPWLLRRSADKLRRAVLLSGDTPVCRHLHQAEAAAYLEEGAYVVSAGVNDKLPDLPDPELRDGDWLAVDEVAASDVEVRTVILMDTDLLINGRPLSGRLQGGAHRPINPDGEGGNISLAREACYLLAWGAPSSPELAVSTDACGAGYCDLTDAAALLADLLQVWGAPLHTELPQGSRLGKAWQSFPVWPGGVPDALLVSTDGSGEGHGASGLEWHHLPLCTAAGLLPELNNLGRGYGLYSCPPLVPELGAQPSSHGQAAAGGARDCARVKVVSANIQTIKDDRKSFFSAAAGGQRRAFLGKQAQALSIDVLCLQECRSNAGRYAAGPYLTWRSGHEKGQYGVEIWVHQGAFGGDLQLQDWRIVASSPRYLVIRCQRPAFPVVIISAHAPHADRPQQDIVDFWSALRREIHALPLSTPLLIGVDANADFTAADGEGQLIGILWTGALHGKGICNFFPSHKTISLRLPPLGAVCIKGKPGHGSTLPANAGATIIFWFLQVVSVRHPRNAFWNLISSTALLITSRSPAAYKSAQKRWQMHRFHRFAKAEQRPDRVVPRQPYISDEALEVLTALKERRRQLRSHARVCSRNLMHLAFRIWSTPDRPRGHVRQCVRNGHRTYARTWLAVLRMKEHAHWLARRDKAAHFQQLTQSATDFWLDTGRAMEATHRLRWASKRAAERRKVFAAGGHDIDADLLRQFQQQEDGQRLTAQELQAELRKASASSCRPCSGALPSLLDVEHQCRRQKLRKAPGPDRISNGLWKGQPVAAAQWLWMLCADIAGRGREPPQFKAALVCALHKKGPASVPSNYRSIALLNGIAKIWHGHVRHSLGQQVLGAYHPLQLGGRRGVHTGFAVASFRSLVALSDFTGRSWFALFLDVQAAYYEADRQLLFGGDHGRARQREASRLVSGLLADGVLRHRGMAEDVCALQEDCVRCSHWSLCGHDAIILAGRGSRPGDGLADVLFGAIFAQILDDVEAQLVSLRIGHRSASEAVGGPCRPIQIAWADDLSVLVDADSATQLADEVPVVTRVVVETAEMYRLRVNLGPGKTEGLLHLRGPGAPAARAALLLPSPQVPFSPGRTLRLVAEYKYLGVPQTAPDNGRRDAEASVQRGQAAWSQANGLMRSPSLPVEVKVAWFTGRVLPAAYSSLATALVDSGRVWTIYQGFFDRCQRSLVASWSVSHHLTREALDVLVPAATPQVATILCRARLAVQIATTAPAAVLDLVEASCERDLPWTSLLKDAVCTVGTFAGLSPDQLRDSPMRIARAHERLLRGACRRFGRFGSGLLAFHRLWRSRAIRVQTGTIGQSHPVQCPTCGWIGRTAQALAAHRHRKHGTLARATELCNGTTCSWCLRDFHSSDRLKYHIATSAGRRLPLEISVGAHHQYGSGTKRRGPQQHRRLPPIQLCGPRNATPAERHALDNDQPWDAAALLVEWEEAQASPEVEETPHTGAAESEAATAPGLPASASALAIAQLAGRSFFFQGQGHAPSPLWSGLRRGAAGWWLPHNWQHLARFWQAMADSAALSPSILTGYRAAIRSLADVRDVPAHCPVSGGISATGPELLLRHTLTFLHLARLVPLGHALCSDVPPSSCLRAALGCICPDAAWSLTVVRDHPAWIFASLGSSLSRLAFLFRHPPSPLAFAAPHQLSSP